MALAILAVARTVDSQSASGERNLQLDVVINGHAIGMLGQFSDRSGELLATRDELRALGFHLIGVTAGGTGTEVLSLSSLPGVSYRVDEGTQIVFVTAASRSLEPTEINPRLASRSSGLTPESGIGAVANYSFVGTRLSGRNVAEGLLDGRIFSPWGVVASSGVATAGGGPFIKPFVRLDSTYTYSDPASLMQYQAGDFINGGLSWTRPVRIAGFQVTTNFGLRPDLVTFPVPTIAGQVAVPSTVDVLVNGVQLLSRDVPPGPFEVRQLPILTGTGDVTMVVKNALGQDTSQTLPVYSSHLLLTPGLSAFSAELGSIRLNYGTRSADYRAPVASVSYRYGLLDWLTLEGHAEATGKGSGYDGSVTNAGGMTGGGLAFTVPRLGVFSFDAAGSRFGRTIGAMVSAGFERLTPVLSLAGSVQAAGAGFGDIAAVYGDPVPRLQTRGSVGLALGAFGSVGLAYVGIRGRSNVAVRATPLSAQLAAQSNFGLGITALLPLDNVSLVSASYSRPVFGGRASLYATAYHDFVNSSVTGAMIGVTIPFGQRGSASVSAGQDGGSRGATIQATQSATTVGDLGWQADASAGAQSRQLAVGQYKSPWGLVSAGADRIAGQTAYRATAQGAIALVDGGLFAANTVYDSFAVVDTGETGGVRVLQENRPVGRTDSSGLLMVPDLRSFDANRLGIEPADVPLDAEVGETTRMVRPMDRSGVVVHFPVRSSRGAIVKFVTAGGGFVPVGSIARLTGAGEGADVAVGYDGETFLTGLGLQNSVSIEVLGGSRCIATFPYKATPGSIPIIGPVSCEQTPK